MQGARVASPALNSSDCLLHIPTMSHSPSASSFICSPFTRHSDSLDIASTQDLDSNSLSLSLIDTDPLGPLLGTGPGTAEYLDDLSRGPHFQQIRDGGARHRVCIALKTLPQSGGKRSEWEVEFR